MALPARPVAPSNDRDLTRLAGGVLASADASSDGMINALPGHCEKGPGVILTANPEDLERLAANYPMVTITGI